MEGRWVGRLEGAEAETEAGMREEAKFQSPCSASSLGMAGMSAMLAEA